MKKRILFITGMLCFAATLRAQSSSAIKPLAVGDTIPDITFEHVLNYKSLTAKLSDFKGKLVILDFWSSWCGVCISLFPHMNELQQRFGDSLQIILVNGKSKLSGDNASKIQRIIDRVNTKDEIKLQLPVVYNCPLLDSFFIYRAIPHEVWINGRGRIITITSAIEVNASNIKAILNGKKVTMRIKKDIMDFDRAKPLFVDKNAGTGDNFLYRSIITGYKGGITIKGQRRNNKNQIVGLYILNQSLISLLQAACVNCTFQPNLIIDETDHTIPLSPPNNESRYQYLYCYDLLIPPTTSLDKLSIYVSEDIERCFHITIRKKKRNMPCLILKAGPRLEKSFAHGDKMEGEFEANTVNKYLKNYPISSVVQLLNSYLPIPLVDETGVNKKINMKLPYDLHDQQAIVQALENVGFSVEEGEREMSVTVISNT